MHSLSYANQGHRPCSAYYAGSANNHESHISVYITFNKLINYVCFNLATNCLKKIQNSLAYALVQALEHSSSDYHYLGASPPGRTPGL